MAAIIDGFHGFQILRSGDPELYKEASTVYATSSYEFDHDMHPGLVIRPADDNDIVTALKWAKAQNLSVSVKSGGHQYSGACSTDGNNIMMDLSQTFRNPAKDLVVLPPTADKTYVYTSVSQGLGELLAFLTKGGYSIPTGQCEYVHVGGHGQTGGYGQLGRSFGLFGDYIRSIRLYDHDANLKEVTKGSDPELFYAILGGSPGNFGVITHYTVEVLRDADYEFGDIKPHAMHAIFLYDPNVLKELLTKIAEMADNLDTPRNYDLCVSVVSTSFRLDLLGPGGLHDLHNPIDGKTILDFGALGLPTLRAAIVVYAQWVPFTKDDRYDQQWFDSIRRVTLLKHIREESLPLSVITGWWIFHKHREFDHPYVKRTYVTDSTSLVRDNWVDAVTERIDMVVNRKYKDTPDNDLYRYGWLSVQIQCFGGRYSKFNTNQGNGTSYSWRNSSICQTLDCFYQDGYKSIADKWQAGNDEVMVGPSSPFSRQDKRVLWGSYGDWDMSKSWPYYHENDAKYKRLGKTRARADPDGMFTPNPFAVERAA